eukprot:355838-Chlamydomonas_euryale.AAC.1
MSFKGASPDLCLPPRVAGAMNRTVIGKPRPRCPAPRPASPLDPPSPPGAPFGAHPIGEVAITEVGGDGRMPKAPRSSWTKGKRPPQAAVPTPLIWSPGVKCGSEPSPPGWEGAPTQSARRLAACTASRVARPTAQARTVLAAVLDPSAPRPHTIPSFVRCRVHLAARAPQRRALPGQVRTTFQTVLKAAHSSRLPEGKSGQGSGLHLRPPPPAPAAAAPAAAAAAAASAAASAAHVASLRRHHDARSAWHAGCCRVHARKRAAAISQASGGRATPPVSTDGHEARARAVEDAWVSAGCMHRLNIHHEGEGWVGGTRVGRGGGLPPAGVVMRRRCASLRGVRAASGAVSMGDSE